MCYNNMYIHYYWVIYYIINYVKINILYASNKRLKISPAWVCDADLKSMGEVFQLSEFASFDESHSLQLWNSIKSRDTKSDESSRENFHWVE